MDDKIMRQEEQRKTVENKNMVKEVQGCSRKITGEEGYEQGQARLLVKLSR